MSQTPKIATFWRHRRTGNLYILYDITNTLVGKDNFPLRMSYMDVQGNRFSRVVDEWNEKFEPVEGLNWQETALLQSDALAIQEILDRLQRNFLAVRETFSSRNAVASIVVRKNGQDWDRAHIGSDYTLDAARRTVREWREKILREDPDARVEITEEPVT